MARISGSTLPHYLRFLDLGEEPAGPLPPISGYELEDLVTLEEAIEPLSSIVDDLPRRAYICKLACKHPADGLTSDESASIQLYTLEWIPSKRSLYYVLNSALRNKDRNTLKPWFLYLKLFLTGLFKLPSLERNVWRGIQGDISHHFETGEEFIWWGLSSCTESLDALKSPQFLGTTGIRTLISIECINGKMIKRHSACPQEDEILLMPGSVVKVRGKVDGGNGLTIVQAKEIIPKFPILTPPFETANKRSTHDDDKWGEDTVKAVLNRLSENTTSLDLSQKNITSDHLKLLAEVLQKPSCTLNNIALQGNQITANGCKILCGAIKNNASLNFLYMLENQIGDEGAEIFGTLLKIDSSIENSDLGPDVPLAVGAKTSKKTTKPHIALTLLDFTSNGIGSKGGFALSEALKVNQTLNTLSLFNNELGDEGAIAIADSLKVNKVLKTLNLGRNSISDKGAIAIGNALKVNKSLANLCLDVNAIDDKGVEGLVQGLLLNQTLTTLNICQNRFSNTSRKLLAHVYRTQHFLMNLFFA